MGHGEESPSIPSPYPPPLVPAPPPAPSFDFNVTRYPSTLRAKPHPTPYWRAGETRNSDRYTVFLDGTVPALCVAANADEGWVECYRTDEWGRIVCDGVLLKPLLDRLYGRVEIRPLIDWVWAWH